MTIEQLIKLAENKLSVLNEQKKYYTQMGDVNKLIELDTEIAHTETTLAQLKTLPHIV